MKGDTPSVLANQRLEWRSQMIGKDVKNTYSKMHVTMIDCTSRIMHLKRRKSIKNEVECLLEDIHLYRVSESSLSGFKNHGRKIIFGF